MDLSIPCAFSLVGMMMRESTRSEDSSLWQPCIRNALHIWPNCRDGSLLVTWMHQWSCVCPYARSLHGSVQVPWRLLGNQMRWWDPTVGPPWTKSIPVVDGCFFADCMNGGTCSTTVRYAPLFDGQFISRMQLADSSVRARPNSRIPTALVGTAFLSISFRNTLSFLWHMSDTAKMKRQNDYSHNEILLQSISRAPPRPVTMETATTLAMGLMPVIVTMAILDAFVIQVEYGEGAQVANAFQT